MSETTWNYRVIRKTKKVKWKKGVYRTLHLYDVHEVLYDKDGKPDAWTEEPATANGVESLGDLKRSLSMMLCDALKHPVMEIVGKKEKRLVERKSHE